MEGISKVIVIVKIITIIMEDIENILKVIGVGRRPANDPFFEETYKCCKVFEKMGVTIEDEEELCHEV